MAHTLAVESEDAHGVVFRCVTCGAVCEFVHPEHGSPNPVQTAEGWAPPENPETWMGPCTQ